MDRKEAKMDTKTYRIPKSFFNDYTERLLLLATPDDEDSSIGVRAVLVKETKKHYWVALTAAQAHDLAADASYYADPSSGNFEWGYQGLISSARATYDALVKQGA